MMVGDDDFAPASHSLDVPKKRKMDFTTNLKLCRKEKNDDAFS